MEEVMCRTRWYFLEEWEGEGNNSGLEQDANKILKRGMIYKV